LWNGPSMRWTQTPTGSRRHAPSWERRFEDGEQRIEKGHAK
jgi:hypothetical protein